MGGQPVKKILVSARGLSTQEVAETEAEAIRIIFDKFGNSDIGLGGDAKYLILQGIKKIPRQNGKLETWSNHLIRQILDNPVYCGKIAYGRRTRGGGIIVTTKHP